MERKSKFIIYKIVNKVLLLPLFYRRLILIFCDAICITISIFICELIIKDFDINNFSENLLSIMFFSIFFALPYYILTGHYRTLARYAGRY